MARRGAGGKGDAGKTCAADSNGKQFGRGANDGREVGGVSDESIIIVVVPGAASAKILANIACFLRSYASSLSLVLASERRECRGTKHIVHR